jgi:hypothetical protein
MSSEDPTQQLSGADTKPSLEAVIHRIDRLGALVLERLSAIEKTQVVLQDSFVKMDVRLDRIESEVKQTHSELYTLRADFKEFRALFKEPA